MIAEFALAVAGLTLIVSNARARKIQIQDKHLLEEHRAIAETLLTEGSPFERDDDAPWFQHTWSEPSKDIVYTSKLPWSYKQITMHITACSKCQTVHKYIVSGSNLAEKLGLHVEEGFYYSGTKVTIPGCPFPDLVGTFANMPELSE